MFFHLCVTSELTIVLLGFDEGIGVYSSHAVKQLLRILVAKEVILVSVSYTPMEYPIVDQSSLLMHGFGPDLGYAYMAARLHRNSVGRYRPSPYKLCEGFRDPIPIPCKLLLTKCLSDPILWPYQLLLVGGTSTCGLS